MRNMLTIKEYLKKPPSHQLYREGLKLFRSVGATKYPDVLKQLERGIIGNNRGLLLLYLRKLKDEPVVEQGAVPAKPKIVILAPPAPTPSNVFRPTDLSAEYEQRCKVLRQLFHKRKRQSDFFHQCSSDLERARNCDAIKKITLEIREAQSDLEYYKQHKKFPIKEEEKGFELATTKEGLQKQNRIVQDRIYRAEKRIVVLLAQLKKQENYRVRMAMEKKEARVKELIDQKQIIKEKLREIGQKNT